MIKRLYLKDCLSFSEVELEFDKGLNVFSGPSGAGKSILMQAILSLFALDEVKFSLGEITLVNSNIQDENFDISSEDDINLKAIKKDKIRYFLNNQSLSKKNLNIFSNSLIKHLNLKQTNDFDSNKLISFLDKLCTKEDKQFAKLKEEFDEKYKEFTQSKKELEKILEDELKLEDLKEFAKFEIEKIESINPLEDEYEQLNEIKKKLSKKEKIQEAIKLAEPIFDYNNAVSNVLEVMAEDSAFFDEAINELNNIFEKFNDSLYELEELDIEEVLTRIEKLSNLQKRFGTIRAALDYKEEKKKELESYENISFEKSLLEKRIKKLEDEILNLSSSLTQYRVKSAKKLEEKINYYLKFLYLSNAKITIQKKPLDSTGCDEIVFELNSVKLETISSGEYNRLRLALLTSISEFDIGENGILFLDEIDANLSGKESESIGKVLVKLSQNYQIFAISHQPQLTSSSHQHFLVDKKNGNSIVKLLNKDEKVEEIARMISGEDINAHALEYAKNILK